ncbi:hypothetical protein [Paenibacillus sp. FSL R10-2734]|uniref:hypothetical protein n=1 Tax=Paenibacillus sp. FSL R10-2734 TaxID=2954691 RepID=UPI0030D6D776
MTHVQMTNQQLNRALAELMGYTVTDFSYGDDPDNYDYLMVVDEVGEQCGEARLSEEEAWDEVPNYSVSVSLEVEVKALDLNTAA